MPGNPIVPVIPVFPVPVVPGLTKPPTVYWQILNTLPSWSMDNAVMANSRNSPFGQPIIAGIKNETLAKGKAVIAK